MNINCRVCAYWFTDIRDIERCMNPQNITTVKKRYYHGGFGPLKEFTAYLQKPGKINKNRDCSGFKKNWQIMAQEQIYPLIPIRYDKVTEQPIYLESDGWEPNEQFRSFGITEEGIKRITENACIAKIIEDEEEKPYFQNHIFHVPKETIIRMMKL